MLIRRLHLVVMIVATGCLVFAAHELKAQFGFGTNAPPCSGPCVPPRGSFGHYRTCWRPWPCAMNSDVVGRAGGAIEGAGTSSVELPPPSNEAEIRIPSPSRARMNPSTPGGQMSPSEMPIPADQMFEPAPRRNDAAPRAIPESGSDINELPPALPPADRPTGPMGSNRMRRDSPTHNPGAMPRLKLRSSGADNVARHEPTVIHGPRLVAEQREESRPVFTTAEQRHNDPAPTIPTKASLEPELFRPSVATKTLNVLHDNAESSGTAGNPLRSDSVHTAVFEEATPTTNNAGGPSPASGAVRSNPLRR